MDKASLALESSNSQYDIYPLDKQGLQCQRIIARFMRKPISEQPLACIHFGEVFAHQLLLQFYRLRSVIQKNTEPLHVLSLYAQQSDARLSTFELLICYPSLQAQFLAAGCLEKLIAEFLPDVRVIDAKHNKLSLDFLAFRECAPLRGEAIVIIQTILKAK